MDGRAQHASESTPTPAPTAEAPMSRRVLVVGSLNVDTVLTVARHPAPGETVSASGRSTGLGGKGANQAIAAARAGARVAMVGAVGAGAEGDIIVDQLHAAGVDATGVQRRPGASGTATVIVADDGENVIVVSPGANADIDLDAVDRALEGIGAGDLVVLQNEIPAAANARAAQEARRRGARVLWNAAPAPTHRDEIPDAVDLVVVNAGELAAVAALLELPADDAGSALDGVAQRLGADIVCTRGGDGAVALFGGVRCDVRSPQVRAVDTTAAGDTFVGYLAALDASPVAERLGTAAAAGAAAVTRPGAASSIPDRAAVAALLASPQENPS